MVFPAHSSLIYITDVGDSACLGGLVMAGIIYLLTRRSKRAAMFLATAFALAVIGIGLLKLAVIGCNSYFHYENIRSPSGHAAISAATFWAVAILMRTQLESSRKFLPLLLLTLLIVLICFSRVALGFHSSYEVYLGAFTGCLCVLTARFFILRGKPISPFDAYALALWGMGAIIVVHGQHLPAENMVQIIATHIRGHVAMCKSS